MTTIRTPAKRVSVCRTAAIWLCAAGIVLGVAATTARAERLGAAAHNPPPPTRPMLYFWTAEKPARLWGHVHTSAAVQVNLTFVCKGFRIVTHRLIRRGTTGPRGRFFFKLQFAFEVSHPMFVTVTAVARDPKSGETSENSFPLAMFPATD
jgi:hypothetical protein